MDFVLNNWELILLAVVSGGMLLWPNLAGAGTGVIPVAQAVQLMNRDKAVMVDVCDSAEFAQGHVAGSRNVPLGELENKLPGAVKNKALPVLMMCASGIRSRRAATIARKLGYEQVHTVAGGLSAWREAGLPVERA